ncbi:hypothetical protein C8J56DRAFT_1042838 [Mycena floridula]|nr:hypothetical protein C8J56DRAFT_1042838 [Mycena floridula]
MRSTSLFIGLAVLGAASSLAAPAPITATGAITARDYNDFQLAGREFLELEARKDPKDTKDTKGGRDTSGGGRRPRRDIQLEYVKLFSDCLKLNLVVFRARKDPKDTKDTKGGRDTSGGGRRPRRSIELEYEKLFTLYGIPFDLCGGGKHARDVELDARGGRDTSGGGGKHTRDVELDARGGRDTSGGGGKHSRN